MSNVKGETSKGKKEVKWPEVPVVNSVEVRCGMCKHWGEESEYTKLRKCEAAKHEQDYLEKDISNMRMYANDLENFGEVMTGEFFGCTMWEKK